MLYSPVHQNKGRGVRRESSAEEGANSSWDGLCELEHADKPVRFENIHSVCSQVSLNNAYIILKCSNIN